MTVGKQRLYIEMEVNAVAEALAKIDGNLDRMAAGGGTVMIELEAHTLRCGKQVRLVVGEVETGCCSPDPKLVQLIAEGHRWFEDLRTGRRATIAGIAAREHAQVSHVSRTIGLAFLAPDIVEMILTGNQPATLTIERLKPRRPLPLDWGEQRVQLLG